ncbi:para-nitrobenzyl esterase [Noviherbaspirillum humi]|uniref:Para-nitrobenzyl esterase n=1 Tax=Noviherbaspirillum humi TaxID=1688639 RepID=A0A239LC62_9BURK|nr:carboxylesterase family protein [Noviherbaspirillum humi]SNT27433.1 para-nitrobenzyl esterase [Noviherbaspirillum humi]
MKLSSWAAAACAGSLALAGCGGDSNNTAAAAYATARDIVTVAGGSIAASADSSAAIRVFKAIPFAAPPVGNLRWKAPQPVAAWSGVRRSDNFAPACLMGNRPFSAPNSILYQDSEPQSEDCLYLNVWTGAASATEKRPVMVLLHGGGNLLGSGAQPNYNGTGLASKGAVVVTLNYRLGALGFMAHPELTAESGNNASGNYALLDEIAALKWVRDNIAQFGGDPANVTLYSESAGSQHASVLMASPLAKGLFHRIVLESLANLPAGTPNTTLAQAEAGGSAVQASLGAANLAAMRARLPQEVMAAAGAISNVIVDGYVLPDQLDLMLANGNFNDVPMMAGWNSDEGTPYPAFAKTLAAYDTAVNARFGSFASQFRQVYPVATDADVVAMAYQPMRDSLFAWQPWTMARSHAAKAKTKTFLYFFNRKPTYYADQKFAEQDPPSSYGAYHSLEQVYFYNNLDRSAPARPYTDVDRAIADAASTYLVNFARRGDPNSTDAGSTLPQWPAFTSAASQTMVIGDTIAPGAVPFRAALDFYDSFYATTLGRGLPF